VRPWIPFDALARGTGEGAATQGELHSRHVGTRALTLVVVERFSEAFAEHPA